MVTSKKTTAGQRLFYLQDGTNSTVQLTNTNGAGVASYAYDSFGIAAASNSSTPANPFTYTGREFDAKSGLYYYRSRYYAPDQGRFLSEDPIAHLNAYTYTQNDPVDFGDPSGAMLAEYAVLNASTQKLNVASCISAGVGAVAGVAAAGISASFDQPGAAANEAHAALVAGALTAGVTCVLAAVGPESAPRSPAFRPDVRLIGGRSGSRVKNLVGPLNSVVRGGKAGRIFQTDAQGKVIADITAERVKPVEPGVGFGLKRAPTQQELDWIDALWPSP